MNSRGMSVTGVLVAVGLFGVLAAGLMSLMDTMSQSHSTSRFKNELEVLNQELRGNLSNRNACRNSFAGALLNASTNQEFAEIKRADNTVFLNKVADAGDHTLKVKSFLLRRYVDEVAPSGVAELFVRYEAKGRVYGGKEIARVIRLRTTKDAANLMTDCFALGSDSDDLWKISPFNANNIYYQGGNVGIGTDNPAFEFMVSGRDKDIVTTVIENEGGPNSVFTSQTSINYSNLGHPAINLMRSRGTKAAPLMVRRDDMLGAIAGWGNNGVADWGGLGTPSAPSGIAFRAAADFSPAYAPTYIQFITSSGTATAGQAGFERMRLESSGYLGLGTSTPEFIFHVNHDRSYASFERSRKTISLDPNSNNTNTEAQIKSDKGMALHLYTDSDRSVGGRLGIAISANALVGIGTEYPGSKLDVSGEIRSFGDTHASDIRYKTDIQSLGGELEKLQKLTGVRYLWKDQDKFPKGPQLGVIAQEVEKVYPELVKTDSDGFKSVSYSHLVAPIIEAIKELVTQTQKSDADLQVQIDDLKNVLQSVVADNKELRLENKDLRLDNGNLAQRLKVLESKVKNKK